MRPQAERETCDKQRQILGLPSLDWGELQACEAIVARNARLWAAWAGLQASWTDWNTEPLLDNTGQARRRRQAVLGLLPCVVLHCTEPELGSGRVGVCGASVTP